MHNYLLPICTFICTIALRGGNTTPSLVADAFCRVWAGHRSTSEIAEVLIRSAVSACPRVGARCYPRYLGITRRSCLEAHMVLDMEYREQERLEHGPGGPIFLLLSQLCPVSSTSFHHYRLGLASKRTLAPWGNWSEVSWYVSYLIIITFLYMHQVPFISDHCLDLTLIHLTIVGVTDGGNLASLYSWVLVSHQRGFAEPSSAPTILSLFHLIPCSSIPFP